MAIITEDYVSFETAKLLKEKGFNEECEYFYDEYDKNEYVICSNGGSAYNDDKHPTYYSMPTIQMAMKWLREVHDIHIAVDRGPKGYHLSIQTIPLGVVKYITREITGNTYVNSYEEAAEAAIKYCLEHLILTIKNGL